MRFRFAVWCGVSQCELSVNVPNPGMNTNRDVKKHTGRRGRRARIEPSKGNKRGSRTEAKRRLEKIGRTDEEEKRGRGAARGGEGNSKERRVDWRISRGPGEERKGGEGET